MTVVLEARGVHVDYEGATTPALVDLSLSIRGRSVTAIVGPNGAGKSTLLRALAGLRNPERGSILLEGEELSSQDRASVARRLAFVPQELPDDLPFTVEEIVMTGRHPHLGWLQLEGRRDWDAVERAMAAMAVDRFRARRIDTLSGGERQRVFMARALAAEPRVLLLDEPAAHLDLGHRMELGQRLLQMAEGDALAIVVVHHDLNLAAETCPQICLLAGGRLVAHGARSEVLTEAAIEGAYGWPVLVDTNPASGAPRITPRPAPAPSA